MITKKTYLMSAGTLAPAFAAVAIRMFIKKKGEFDTGDIILFAGVSLIAGYYTAKLLKN